MIIPSELGGCADCPDAVQKSIIVSHGEYGGTPSLEISVKCLGGFKKGCCKKLTGLQSVDSALEFKKEVKNDMTEKKKVPIFSPCEHHVVENPNGLGWDAADDNCKECVAYFPEYAEACKQATLAKAKKGSVKFVEMEETVSDAEKAEAKQAVENGVSAKTVEQIMEGGEETVATTATKTTAEKQAKAKSLASKKVSSKEHTFKPGTARGEIYAMLSKGMKPETILAKVMEKYSYTQPFAKAKIAVVKKLANL